MPLRRMFATPCDRCFLCLRPAGPFCFFRFSPLTCLFKYLPLTCLFPASFLPLHSGFTCREPLRDWLFGVASYRFCEPLHRFQDSYLSSLLMAYYGPGGDPNSRSSYSALEWHFNLAVHLAEHLAESSNFRMGEKLERLLSESLPVRV